MTPEFRSAFPAFAQGMSKGKEKLDDVAQRGLSVPIARSFSTRAEIGWRSATGRINEPSPIDSTKSSRLPERAITSCRQDRVRAT